jgi:hypothetical protein
MSTSIGRLAFSAGCVAALVVSAAYPAWGAIQQNEAYGGYVDMALETLGLPSNTVAGVSTSLPLRVHNRGPDIAEFPQVLFSGDARLVPSQSSGCLDSPAPLTRCRLASLAPGESRVVDFEWTVGPALRGSLTLGAVALSEAIDIESGNEMILAAPRIDPFVDLDVRTASRLPLTDVDGNLRWTIEVFNLGPSAALEPTIIFSLMPQALAVVCTAGPGARCEAGPPNTAFIGPGSSLFYDITFPPLSDAAPYVAITVGAAAAPGEREMNPFNDWLSIDLLSNMFGDDFE